MVKKTLYTLLAVFAVVALVLSLNTEIAYADSGLNIYGYFSVNYEDVGKTPDGGNDPGEFSFPHLNLMVQSRLADAFRIYLNFAGDDGEAVEVRNYWGEYAAADYLKFRLGKIYRPFGLFNEKLDAVPTYLGIEPPELFDGDHLLLPRTGILMVHGSLPVSNNTLEYSFMTGNKEVIDEGKPMSWDLNFNIANKTTIGTSGYFSKEPGSPIEVGEGSPPGGVLPWMASDKYTVFGGYLKTQWRTFTLKAAYWTADHDAIRDPAQVAALVYTDLNQRQIERFGLATYDPLTAADDYSMINTDADYTVSTYYIRFGYTIPGGTINGVNWDITPFFFWDYYENPETVASKSFGGDNEAGVSDDGKFTKPTIGVAVKPISNVTFKVDASSHLYKWTDPDNLSAGSQNVHYEEIRFDLSYFFK